MMKLELTSQFKKDYAKIKKRGLDVKKLEAILNLLLNDQALPPKYRDHALVNSRNYKNMRECHIQPDWLLIYYVKDNGIVLVAVRTGTHSDLF